MLIITEKGFIGLIAGSFAAVDPVGQRVARPIQGGAVQLPRTLLIGLVSPGDLSPEPGGCDISQRDEALGKQGEAPIIAEQQGQIGDQ
ncbi:MAG: hypothetical protein PHR21_08975, partial [Oscillospiraceae bacterium]|nr:hypothetical protein [Oscillospiraceae bacterium]